MRPLAGLCLTTLTLSILGLAAAPVATAVPAAYASVTFVDSVTDDADYAAFGFLDIRGLAFGEPGDGTLVFRFEVNDITDVPPTPPVPRTCTPSPAPAQCTPGPPALNAFYTVNDKAYRSGVGATGATSSTNPFAGDCLVEGNFLYCKMPYATLGAAVGDTVTGVNVISYEGSAQDYAPGGTYAEETAASGAGVVSDAPSGTDYVLTGGAATGPIRLNVTTVDFTAGLTAPTPVNGTYIYAWNNTFAAANLTVVASVDGGHANLVVRDGGNQTVASLNISMTKRTTVVLPAVTPGPWTVTLNYTAFQGRLNVTITKHTPPVVTLPSGTTTSTTASSTTQATTSAATTTTTTKGTPGVGVLALLGLVALAVAVRRRL